jgi:hypothetical protein
MAWVGARPPTYEENPVDSSPPQEESIFEQLLSAAPSIARAIKFFDDPEIQRAMFGHLVSALIGAERQPRPTPP